MANDKFKDLTPVQVTFAQGERPTNDKLNGAFGQMTDALAALEFLVGDPYGYSGNKPYNFINNFSRDIGNRDLLSPKHEPAVTVNNYTQSLTADQCEHELDLIPVGVGAAIINSSTDASLVPAQFKASIGLLDTVGDWTLATGLNEDGLQKNSRKLITYAPAEGNTIEFAQVTTGHGDTYIGGSWNVMPTQAQVDADGDTLTVELLDAVNNIYAFTLPTHDTQLNRLGASGSSTLSNTVTTSSGQQLTLPPYFFDPSGLDLESNDGVTGLGKIFPLGLVRIWDWDSNTIVEGLLEVKAADLLAERKYKIICTFEPEVVIDAVNGKYSLLVSGTGLSELVDKLRTEFYNHDHESDDLVRHISHASLMGLRTVSAIENLSEWYGASSINNNDHSMYLHRNGFDLTDTGGGYNIMRGDILIGSQTAAGAVPNYNLSSDSYSLIFGTTAGPEIYFDFQATHDLIFGEALGAIPELFQDQEVLRIVGADSGSVLTTLVEGNFRVLGDTVFGSDQDSIAAIQGTVHVGNALRLLSKANLSGETDTGRIEYVDRPVIYDGARWKGLIYSMFSAVIGSSEGCTHADLDAVMADVNILDGDRVLLKDNIALAAATNITKSLWVEGFGTGKQIDGSALATSEVGLTVSASRTMWKNIDFTGFDDSKTAILFDVGADEFRVHECFFDSTNSTDVDIDASITNFSIANNITY